MQLNSRKDSRQQRIEQALKNNLKKRKIFQNKINKDNKKIKKRVFCQIVGLKRWLSVMK